MANKLTQFFYNLITGGGISLEKGVIYVWGDPNVLFSLEGFSFLQNFLREKFGDDGLNLLYWLGKVNGRTATEVLIKRYGFNAKDLPKFVNGATQDGFGHYKLTESKDVPKHFAMTGTNCVFAETYKKMYGRQDKPVCGYMCGVIAGGSEPLFKMKMECKEEKCVAMGAKISLIHGGTLKEKETFPLVKKSKVDVDKLLKKSTERYFKVAGNFKLMPKRSIKVGDGSFVCNGVKGVIIAQRMVIILLEILKPLLKNDFQKFVEGVAEKNVDAIYNPSIKLVKSREVIDKILSGLSTFGLGEFKLVRISNSKIYIQNSSTTYPNDYKFIAGNGKKPVDCLCTAMLEKLFEKYSKGKAKVKELKCKANNHPFCLYEVYLSE